MKMCDFNKTGISTILIVVIAAVLIGVAIGGYILISKPSEKEIGPPV